SPVILEILLQSFLLSSILINLTASFFLLSLTGSQIQTKFLSFFLDPSIFVLCLFPRKFQTLSEHPLFLLQKKGFLLKIPVILFQQFFPSLLFFFLLLNPAQFSAD